MIVTTSPLISILIVTLRGGKNLKNCLLSLKKGNYKSVEVVIVNNGGGPKIDEEVKTCFPRAKVVNLEKNTGFAKGNNIGYRYCLGKYILFLNDDTVTTPDILKILIREAEKKENEEIAILQPKTIFTTGKLQAGADFLTCTGFLYHYGYGKETNNSIYNSSLYMYAANGNCMLVKKEAIVKVGLFDNDFYAYFEETDFCHRIWLAGYKIVYIPAAIVYHKGSETSKLLHKSTYLYHPYKNRLCAHLKNFGLGNLVKTIPVLLALYQAVSFYYLIKGQLAESYYIQKAIWWNIKHLSSTLRKRRHVQKKIRTQNDNKFFPLISYSPRLSYYFHLINNLERYKDDNLVKDKIFILNNDTKLDKNSSALVATFSPWLNGKRLPTNGSVEPLINFFTPKIKKLVMIDQPLPQSDFLLPRWEIYHQQKMQLRETPKWFKIFLPFLNLFNNPGTHIIFKLRDFFSVIDWCLHDNTCFDYFIGMESINTLAGIIMKKFGKIKSVIYYVSDYSPSRYSAKWFNWLYLFLDRVSAMYADYIWDVSQAMYPARIKAGLDPKKAAPVIHVPNGLNPSQIKYNSFNQIKPFSLIYMGTLGKENGPDMAIEAMPDILAKYPQTTLQLIGGGGEKDLPRLKQLISDLGLEKEVKLHGYILDGNQMSKIIRSCYIALAPYRCFPGSPRYYGDAGKIRAYTAAGLPIITTDVPPLGKEVTEKGAALIARDTSSDFAGMVMKIFSDRKLYMKLRKNAIAYAKDNTWKNSFNNAFEKMKTINC